MGKGLSKENRAARGIHRDESSSYLVMGATLLDRSPTYTNLPRRGGADPVHVRQPTDVLPLPPIPDSAPDGDYLYANPRRRVPIIPPGPAQHDDQTREEILHDDTQNLRDDSGFEDYPRPDCLRGIKNLISLENVDESSTDDLSVDLNNDPPPGHVETYLKEGLEEFIPIYQEGDAESDTDGYQNLDDCLSSVYSSVTDETTPSDASTSQRVNSNAGPVKHVKKIYNNCTFIKFEKSSGVQVGQGGAMNYGSPTDILNNLRGGESLQTLQVLMQLAQQLGYTITRRESGVNTETKSDQASDCDSVEYEVEERSVQDRDTTTDVILSTKL